MPPPFDAALNSLMYDVVVGNYSNNIILWGPLNWKKIVLQNAYEVATWADERCIGPLGHGERRALFLGFIAPMPFWGYMWSIRSCSFWTLVCDDFAEKQISNSKDLNVGLLWGSANIGQSLLFHQLCHIFCADQMTTLNKERQIFSAFNTWRYSSKNTSRISPQYFSLRFLKQALLRLLRRMWL